MIGSRKTTPYDAIIIGGGPAGSITACLLAQAGYRALVLERDIHPRDHVGESLTPSTNFIFKRIGVLEKIEEAGYIHKPGACWTSAHGAPGKFLSISLAEFPPPGAFQFYSYNVERADFDAMLLRQASELGAHVLQGVSVCKVLFDGDRAVGVRAEVSEGWAKDLYARFVIDASGRSCLLASQLGLKVRDPVFNQLSIYSWFRNVAPSPPGTEGYLFLHFVALERGWVWQIPLRNGIHSIGAVTDKVDFKRPQEDAEDFFQSLVERNLSLKHYMRHAERVRPWKAEGDYTYKITRLHGPGWLLVGDALRFVDPVFSTGVDVAAFSALYAFEAIDAVSKGAREESVFPNFEHRVSDGVEAWYDLIALFYKLQNLFTYFAIRKRYREQVVRILQGNLYQPETVERARELIAMMEEAYQRISSNPNHLLRPGALRPPDQAARPSRKQLPSNQADQSRAAPPK
jgi:FADH2 O2-dependent halogenase